jgi:hypothetical protein
MAAKKKASNVIKTRMVGLQYRLTKQARDMLATHTPFEVRLEREPLNSKDENAIMVWTTDEPAAFHKMQLGYVKRETASVLAPALDAGAVKIAKATITFLHAVEGEGEMTIRLGKTSNPHGN